MDYKYKAFISYCHRDTVYAEKISQILAGKNNPTVQQRLIAKTLQPIFKDKSTIPFGEILTQQTIDELKSSGYLIVLCSPNAAVNEDMHEEIRFFKAMGRKKDIMPIIVDSGNVNSKQDCFPRSLLCKVDDRGLVTNELDDIQVIDIDQLGDDIKKTIIEIRNSSNKQRDEKPVKLQAETVKNFTQTLPQVRTAPPIDQRRVTNIKNVAEDPREKEPRSKVESVSQELIVEDHEEKNEYTKKRDIAVDAKVVSSRPLVDIQESRKISIPENLNFGKKPYVLIPVICSLLLVIAISGYFILTKESTPYRVDDKILPLMVRYAASGDKVHKLPAMSKGLKQTFFEIVALAEKDEEYKEVLRFLNGGNPKQAELLLKNIASKQLGSSSSEAAAQAYRNYGIIASINNIRRAIDPFARAAKLDPSNAAGMFWHGWLQKNFGSKSEARRAFSSVMTREKTSENNWFINNARLSLWDLDNFQRTAEQDNLQTNIDRTRERIKALNSKKLKIESQESEASQLENDAESLLSLGNLDQAIDQYNSALILRLSLAKFEPENKKRLLEVYRLHNKLASIMVDKADYNGASSRYLAALNIIEKLLIGAPQDDELKQFQVEIHQKLAQVKMANQEHTEALRLFTKALIISRPYAETIKSDKWVEILYETGKTN